MPSDWILEDNLKPSLETLAAFSGYNIDAWDWDAIWHGVKDTDVERGAWFEYELAAGHPVGVRVAKDVGSSMVFVDVRAGEELEAKMQAALEIMQTYHLMP